MATVGGSDGDHDTDPAARNARRRDATDVPSVSDSEPMHTIPLDEGPRSRRRIGPFWIEEGMRAVAVMAAVLALVAVFYGLAVALRPG